MNDISDEVLGSRELLQEDLTNITDFGTQLFGATSVDNYVTWSGRHREMRLRMPYLPL